MKFVMQLNTITIHVFAKFKTGMSRNIFIFIYIYIYEIIQIKKIMFR